MSLKLTWSVAAVAAFVCSGAQASPVNLIQDGSFETPKLTTWYQNYGMHTQNPWSGFSFSPYWIIFPNNVDLVSGPISGAPAYNGNNYLDLVGYGSTGGISQVFKTTPGETYDLSFAYGNNPWSTSTASASVNVYGLNGTHIVDLLTADVTHSGSTTSNIYWTVFTETFTADYKLTTLVFNNIVGGNNGGALLDAVSVTATPLPATWSLMLVGLAELGFVAYRQRSTDPGTAVA